MKLLILAATLALPSASPPAPVPPSSAATNAAQNVYREQPGCVPIRRQVSGEDREYRGTLLDRQPPAQLLLAVDREVNGCREATILRRDIAPQASQPEEPRRD